MGHPAPRRSPGAFFWAPGQVYPPRRLHRFSRHCKSLYFPDFFDAPEFRAAVRALAAFAARALASIRARNFRSLGLSLMAICRDSLTKVKRFLLKRVFFVILDVEPKSNPSERYRANHVYQRNRYSRPTRFIHGPDALSWRDYKICDASH
jgi:hypothetical protein